MVTASRTNDFADLARDIKDDRCPDCGYTGLTLGPRGGASRNVECPHCGAKFNAIGGWVHLAWTFAAERLGDATRPRVALRRRAREKYFDPEAPQRICMNEACLRPYNGYAVYCSLHCAEGDA